MKCFKIYVKIFCALNVEAKKKIIEHNLGLIVNFSKYYLGNGLSLSDLIQEENLGLMKAVENLI